MITPNKDRKQTKYGHKTREHKTHTTEDWHNYPHPEGASRAITVPPGGGGGCCGETVRRPWRSWEPWRPWKVATTAGALLPPPPPTSQKKQTWGSWRGTRSPPGLNTRTTQPTATGSPSWTRLGCGGHEVRGPHRIPQQPLPSPRQERQYNHIPYYTCYNI